jgi:hypothetical protein
MSDFLSLRASRKLIVACVTLLKVSAGCEKESATDDWAGKIVDFVRSDSLNCVGNGTKIHRRNRQQAYLVADAKCSQTIGAGETDVSRRTVNVIALIEQEAGKISTVRASNSHYQSGLSHWTINLVALNWASR